MIIFLGVLSFPGRLPAQTDSADVVTLSFNWPVGLTARVTHVREQIRDNGESVDTTGAAITYSMHVRQQGAGRLVSFDDFELVGGAPEDGGEVMQQLTEQIGTFMPALVIDSAGDVTEISGVEQMVSQVRALLQPMLDSLPPEAGGLNRLLERMLSQSYFEAKALEDWNALIGLWRDAEFELGAVYQLEADEPIPILPGRTIPFVYEFSFLERAPCSEERTDSSCVVLEMISVPDADSLASLLEAVFGEAAPELGEGRIIYRKLDLENYIRLLTEPSGLIPHRLEIIQVFGGDIEVPGEGQATVYQERTRRFHYVYEPEGR
ncbi:MAG: hypothetical protein R3282_08715 [Rhodothermales bacterium]|nr:hypothetical protein [Rhodothermales bacterium]